MNSEVRTLTRRLEKLLRKDVHFSHCIVFSETFVNENLQKYTWVDVYIYIYHMHNEKAFLVRNKILNAYFSDDNQERDPGMPAG